MPKNPTSPKIRTYISTFTMRLDLLTFTGKLMGVRKTSEDAETHYVSPSGNRVNKMWRDVETLEIFEDNQMRTGIWGDPTSDAPTMIVDKDAVTALKRDKDAIDLIPNVLTVTVHNSADVDHYLYPTKGNGYVFEPDAASRQWNDLFIAALQAKPEKTLLGMCLLAGNEGLFRVHVWRGRLLIHAQMYSNDINEHERYVAPTLDTKLVNRFAGILDATTEDFYPADYRNVSAERVRAALNAATTLTLTPSPTVKQEMDLDSLLDKYFKVS